MAEKPKRIPWNKGKKGVQIGWLKGKKGLGLVKPTPESNLKRSLKLKGRFMSPETRKKISEGLKAHTRTKQHAKNIGSSHKGKLWTEERKAKHKTFVHHGKMHPSWKGGRRKYLRDQAILRDDYTCQVCQLRDPEIMHADHIQPKSQFPELANELSNLRTICPNCHERKSRKEHKKWKPILTTQPNITPDSPFMEDLHQESLRRLFAIPHA